VAALWEEVCSLRSWLNGQWSRECPFSLWCGKLGRHTAREPSCRVRSRQHLKHVEANQQLGVVSTGPKVELAHEHQLPALRGAGASPTSSFLQGIAQIPGARSDLISHFPGCQAGSRKWLISAPLLQLQRFELIQPRARLYRQDIHISERSLAWLR